MSGSAWWQPTSEPDHVTICRFIARHRDEMEDLFVQVVGLAAEAGLVDVTVVAVDGTKMAGDASPSRNRRLGDLRARYAGWADDVEANDAADDTAEADDSDRGPIPEMVDPDTMRQWIRRRLRERAAEVMTRPMNVTDPDSGCCPDPVAAGCRATTLRPRRSQGGIVIAADVSANPADSTMLAPMVTRDRQAAMAASGEQPAVVVADAGYWHSEVIDDDRGDDDLPECSSPPAAACPTRPPARCPNRTSPPTRERSPPTTPLSPPNNSDASP